MSALNLDKLQVEATHYDDVLTSERWRYITGLLKTWHEGCQACGSTNTLQTHHAHYNTLGNEQPQDLVVLCDDCHQAVHDYRWPHEEIDELRAQNPLHWRSLVQHH